MVSRAPADRLRDAGGSLTRSGDQVNQRSRLEHVVKPVIETERLVLRRLTVSDAPFMLSLLNQPSFIRNIGDRGARTVEQAEAYIRNGPVASYALHGFGLYLVVVRDGGEAVGICGLVKREGLEDVDLGFAFLPSHWKKGYALESARAVMRYAAGVVGLKRLVAITSPANEPSIRVLEKLGFAFERMVRPESGAVELKLFSCVL
jgi:RimJ/RimL family protein N-acetyltransferase